MVNRTTVACLPDEVFQHICQSLDLASITTLRSSSRSLGGHCVDVLLTGMEIPLDEVDICRRRSLLASLQRMSRLTHLHLVATRKRCTCTPTPVTAPVGHGEASSSDVDDDQSDSDDAASSEPPPHAAGAGGGGAAPEETSSSGTEDSSSDEDSTSSDDDSGSSGVNGTPLPPHGAGAQPVSSSDSDDDSSDSEDDSSDDDDDVDDAALPPNVAAAAPVPVSSSGSDDDSSVSENDSSDNDDNVDDDAALLPNGAAAAAIAVSSSDSDDVDSSDDDDDSDGDSAAPAAAGHQPPAPAAAPDPDSSDYSDDDSDVDSDESDSEEPGVLGPAQPAAGAAAVAVRTQQSHAQTAVLRVQQQHQRVLHQQDQTLLLMTHFVVPNRSLTTLTLGHLAMSSIIIAAGCLASACPNLVCLQLEDIDASERQQQQACMSRGWDIVWSALSRAGALRRLILHNNSFRVGELDNLEQLTQLESLTLDNWDLSQDHWCVIDDFSMPQLLGLEELNIRVSPDDLYQLVGLSQLTALRSLQLAGNEAQDWLLDELFPALPALTRLTRLVYVEVGAQPLVPLPQQLLLPTLLSLRILECRWFNFSVESLAGLRNLTSLTCGNLALPEVGSTARLPHLRTLRCTTFGPEGVGSQADVHSLEITAPALLFPVLEALEMCGDLTAGLPPASVEYAGWTAQLWQNAQQQQQQRHALRHLTALRWCRMDLPVALAHACVALHTLSLRCDFDKQQASSISLAALRVLGRQVTTLELNWPGEDEFVKVLAAFPCVATLLIKTANITDFGLAAVSHSRSLRDVHIVHCCQITATGLVALAMNRSVQRIRLRECALITATDAQRVMDLAGRPWLILDIDEVAPQPLRRSWGDA